MSQDIVISLEDITITREENIIFQGLNLEIKSGEFVYLLGKVGSGKSTLLKSLYREVLISKGKAKVLSYDITKLKQKHIPKLRRQLGIIFQDFQLLADRTVTENLDIVLRATTTQSKASRTTLIRDTLNEVGLSNKGYKYPHELSGGEQQRVAIGRAIIGKPKIILADEPTANLDEDNGMEIATLLCNLSKEHNITVLMATHNKKLLSKIPGREIYIRQKN